MNAEQKQRAVELLAAWQATAYALHADRMANLLQEMVDAPEVEPFAVIHLDGSFVHVEFKQPIAGTGKFEVYAAPPAPSVPDVARDAERWQMLPAFLAEFQVPYLQLVDKIDAAMSEKGQS